MATVAHWKRSKVKPLRTRWLMSCFQRLHSSSNFPRSYLPERSFERLIEDDFDHVRESYGKPANPIVLAHGLFGFDELHIGGRHLPGIHYWRGVVDALNAQEIEVFTAEVPASASIEERAERLKDVIDAKVRGKSVNIIAGLDSRYLISQLRPKNFKVLSLTTIATPHRGSEIADSILRRVEPFYLSRLYRILKSVGISTGAFSQLTRSYMIDSFNEAIVDDPNVRYFSYGAANTPSPWSTFRKSHRIIEAAEGPNDGLVSVDSSKWGEYKGTLAEVSHLDLINWTNRFRWLVWEMTGNRRKFNAIAFYLDIADMLAKEGL